MAFDLLEEKWLFVRRRGSGPCRIAPWQLTENHQNDPVVALDFPRADLNGGMVQFLIGLIQTAFPPKDEKTWRGLWNSPPEPQALREAFVREADAFLLDGDGPRFMQDLTLTAAEKSCKTRSVEALFVESPGEDSADLFVKRGQIERLCPACAATALFTLQTNGPQGGSGHLTGLRSDGPLTTLVLPAKEATLWQTVWGNVFPARVVAGWPGDSEAKREFGVYPWLAPTRAREKSRQIHPVEVSPLHAYWGMPRRIRLFFEIGKAQSCHLCGLESDIFVSKFWIKKHGNDYAKTWRHPLTPCAPNKEGLLLPVKGTPDDMGYRLWRGAVYENEGRLPARIVQYASNHRLEELDPNSTTQFRLWAFGFHMKQAKARSWAEGVMPVLTPPPGDSGSEYYTNVLLLIDAADIAANALQSAARVVFKPPTAEERLNMTKQVSLGGNKAWKKLPKLRTKHDALLVQTALISFWETTKPEFNIHTNRIRDVTGDKKTKDDTMKSWIRVLCKQTVHLFEETSAKYVDWNCAPLYAVLAEKWLEAQISIYNKVLADKLGLALPEQSKPNKRGQKAS